jgi:predicted dehydrogenase
VLVKESIDTEDSIHAIVTYKNGMQVTYTSNWIMPRSMPLLYDLKFEIVGTKGALQLDCFDQMVHKFSREKYEHPFIMQQEINGKVVGMWAHMIDAFLNSLINDTDPPVTAYDGLQATKVVEAIHASIKTGSVVNIE